MLETRNNYYYKYVLVSAAKRTKASLQTYYMAYCCRLLRDADRSSTIHCISHAASYGVSLIKLSAFSRHQTATDITPKLLYLNQGCSPTNSSRPQTEYARARCGRHPGLMLVEHLRYTVRTLPLSEEHTKEPVMRGIHLSVVLTVLLILGGTAARSVWTAWLAVTQHVHRQFVTCTGSEHYQSLLLHSCR